MNTASVTLDAHPLVKATDARIQLMVSMDYSRGPDRSMVVLAARGTGENARRVEVIDNLLVGDDPRRMVADFLNQHGYSDTDRLVVRALLRTAPLFYRPGVSMSMEPVNVALYDLAQSLRAGMPEGVILEPGDATKYELRLRPRPGRRMAVQYGNKIVEVAPGFGHSRMAELTENLWTRTLFTWWMDQLFVTMGWQDPDA